MKHQTIWAELKIKNVAKKYDVNTVYLCLKNGCDALAIMQDDLLVILPKSRVSPTDDAFNAKLNLIQDMRRVAEKFNGIKNNTLKRAYRFSTFARAAQFVSAKHSARANDWKEIKVTQ
jgi:hypothetical protein